MRKKQKMARPPFYRDERVLRVIGQLLFITLVALFFIWLATNMVGGLRRQGIQLGFDFLNSRAGFDISESQIAYTNDSSIGRSLLVGLVNTLFLSGLGILFATVLGLLVGVGQLSENILVRTICKGYVELMRNMPLLVYLIFLYFGVFVSLPPPSQSIELGPLIINNRGFNLPWVVDGQLSFPLLIGRDINGGLNVSPEFMCILVGLVTFTAAGIGEVTRAGIQSVTRGQVEAARALGLSNAQTLRLITLPQALRVMIPPLTSQYLNLTKNSSLAGAVAYPDLVGNANTVINQTGRAVETIGILMLAYLSISLLTSAFMNWYNQRVRLVER